MACRVFSAGDEPALLDCGGGRGPLKGLFSLWLRGRMGYHIRGELKHRSEKTQDEDTHSVDSAWAHLASRALRAALIYQGVSYEELARRLVARGTQESERSIEGKIHRGTFKFAFLLQALIAAGSALPSTWLSMQQLQGSWEDSAAAAFKADLATQPWLDTDMLSSRLEELGVHVQADSLSTQIEDGTFSAALYFQCATVCRFDALWLYLDVSIVNNVAVQRKLP
jgi:hypothetical protein